jgi:TPP-dependent pyruvate/acetoin dehydrogenase alpha subunit
MFQTVLDPGAVAAPMFRDVYLKAYRLMLLARMLDEKMASLYRAGKIHGGVFIGRGQEALSVALGIALRKGDAFAPSIRDGAGRLAFGEPIVDAIRTYMGSPLGPMRARDGNVHRGRPREGMLAMISHLGSNVSVVNGILFARRMRGVTGIVGGACLGDGATSTGASHEALNQAGVEKLPLVVVIANNHYAYSTILAHNRSSRDSWGTILHTHDWQNEPSMDSILQSNASWVHRGSSRLPAQVFALNGTAKLGLARLPCFRIGFPPALQILHLIIHLGLNLSIERMCLT